MLRTDAMTMRRLLPVVAPQREVNGAKTARHSAGAQGRPSCHRNTNHVTRNRSAKSQVVAGGISANGGSRPKLTVAECCGQGSSGRGADRNSTCWQSVVGGIDEGRTKRQSATARPEADRTLVSS